MLPTLSLTTDPAAPPASVLTREQAAGILGLSPKTVAKLTHSGYLADLSADRVLTLSRAPHVHLTDGVLPVLRTAPATAPPGGDDGRTRIGDSADMDDAQWLEASARWWRSDAETITTAGVLAVAQAGFVTGVLAIHGLIESRQVGAVEVRHSYKATVAGRLSALDDPGTRRILTADPAMAHVTGQLLGARVHTVSGGPLAYLKAGQENRR